MTPADLRAACLALPEAREGFPFPRYPDRSVFTVAEKVFAISSLADEPLRVSLKCNPDLAIQLRIGHPEVQPGYRLNKRHWNTVYLDGALPDAMVRGLIEDSYDLVVAGLPAARRPGRVR